MFRVGDRWSEVIKVAPLHFFVLNLMLHVTHQSGEVVLKINSIPETALFLSYDLVFDDVVINRSLLPSHR